MDVFIFVSLILMVILLSTKINGDIIEIAIFWMGIISAISVGIDIFTRTIA